MWILYSSITWSPRGVLSCTKFMGAGVSFVDIDIFMDAVSSVTFVDSVSNMKYVVYDLYLKSLFCESTASNSHKTNGKY